MTYGKAPQPSVTHSYPKVIPALATGFGGVESGHLNKAVKRFLPWLRLQSMGFRPLKVGTRAIGLHKAAVQPAFGSRTVLVSDAWDYVEMWLRRNRKADALFYWQQSHHFYRASLNLPKVSSPLTAYYCFLNAGKALLSVKGINFQEKHGVSGHAEGTKVALANEHVDFEASGILTGLGHYYEDAIGPASYTLKELLYNLPFIHRAYTLTYSQPELFYPIKNPHFVRKDGSSEAWLCAEIVDPRYANNQTIKKLPSGFERDNGIGDKWVIRKKNRLEWKGGKANKAGNLARLAKYHQNVRRTIVYIHGASKLWYFKRDGLPDVIPRSTVAISFAAMHRLSELSRYEPMHLSKHFERHHNWLLSEYIATAPTQYINEISCEITGQDFMIPGRRG